ncbi:hypothetical protein FE257_008276 [Aspergillus nanangensis]|uniref:O-methyltransferase domain-containing protein n=1 Tax=Aspergillus nanangensis TaxID=2582783 RepID=A0AAD4CLY0_ASPNN|nr:hypothetical protein FE257_008276 [Aspergillus nanangensis]
MGSVGDAISLLAKGEENDFQALGVQLLQAMTTYTQALKDENLPPPSLRVSPLPDARVKSSQGKAAKQAIIEISQLICAATMDPELNLLISSLQFHFCSCLKVAIDLRVHNFIPLDGAVALSQLAKLVGAEEALLVRIMRVLVNKHVFRQPQPGYYAHTRMSSVLLKPNTHDLLCHRLEEVFRSASREADSLAAGGYREPKRGLNYGFNLAFDTDKNFWNYISEDDPSRGQRFGRAMHAVNINSTDTVPRLYPFDSLVVDGGLIVDVGGGEGQVAKGILNYYPNSGLRCIVQDGLVKKSTAAGPAVEMQPHDFFDPQPVKGAAAYFFRHIFHDWPDNACVTILRQTAKAMDKHKSRILICDQVMQDDSPTEASILYDIDMMSLFGGKERTLGEWKRLVASADAGLDITNVAYNPECEAAILELRLQ